MPVFTKPNRIPLRELDAEYDGWLRQMSEQFPQHANLFQSDPQILEGDDTMNEMIDPKPETVAATDRVHTDAAHDATELQEAGPPETPKPTAFGQAKHLVTDAVTRAIVLLLAMSILSGFKATAVGLMMIFPS